MEQGSFELQLKYLINWIMYENVCVCVILSFDQGELELERVFLCFMVAVLSAHSSRRKNSNWLNSFNMGTSEMTSEAICRE